MLVGAIADTHDNLEPLEKALEIFREQKVEALIHCGDFITTIVYDLMSKLSLPIYGVFGNNDYKEALSARSRNQIKEEPYRFELAGRRIFICHRARFVNTLVGGTDANAVDLVVYGETHAPEIRRQGNLLIVNPGESCGWITGTSTVAVIDLAQMSPVIITVPVA